MLGKLAKYFLLHCNWQEGSFNFSSKGLVMVEYDKPIGFIDRLSLLSKIHVTIGLLFMKYHFQKPARNLIFVIYFISKRAGYLGFKIATHDILSWLFGIQNCNPWYIDFSTLWFSRFNFRSKDPRIMNIYYDLRKPEPLLYLKIILHVMTLWLLINSIFHYPMNLFLQALLPDIVFLMLKLHSFAWNALLVPSSTS